MTGSEKKKVGEHIEICPSCRTLIPTASEIEEFDNYLAQSSNSKKKTNVEKRRPLFELLKNSSPRFGLALAACVLLVIIYLAKDKEVAQIPTTRNSETETDLVVIEPDTTEDNLDFKFIWRPHPEATRYELIIWDNDAPSQRDTTISTRSTRIAATDIPFLRRDRSYSYQIRALVGTELKNRPKVRIVKIKQ